MALAVVISRCPHIENYMLIRYSLSDVLKKKLGIMDREMLNDARDLEWCAYVEEQCVYSE